MNYWENQLSKFREMKRKSVGITELLAVAENYLTKIKSLQEEKQQESESLKKEIEALKEENKSLRDELEIAWKSS